MKLTHKENRNLATLIKVNTFELMLCYICRLPWLGDPVMAKGCHISSPVTGADRAQGDAMLLHLIILHCKNFLQRKDGASGIEYAVIAAMVAVVLAGFVPHLGRGKSHHDHDPDRDHPVTSRCVHD
jgi:pilus assembly protein Flp/PilA